MSLVFALFDLTGSVKSDLTYFINFHSFYLDVIVIARTKTLNESVLSQWIKIREVHRALANS